MSFRASIQATRALPRAHQRSYSFFSSKSGAGRYISATKPPKVDPTAPTPPTAPGQQLDAGADELDSTTAGASTAAPPASTSPAPEPQPQPTFAASPLFEDLSLTDLRLHAFFAHHRPLLLLPLPASALFAAPPPQADAAQEVRIDGPHLSDDPPEATPETDADAARVLSRSLVMNRIGAWADWHAVLDALGHADAGAQLDSTRRKKRKKMKKHKLSKRRRVRPPARP